MTENTRPLRADARRNRERIMTSAGELFARLGHRAQMEDIAAHCGLGMGTLYRHFPNKRALLTAIVQERFHGMADLARATEEIDDPGEALEAVLRGYLEAANGDAGFQLALMGSDGPQWEDVRPQKAEFAEAVGRIIDHAVSSGRVREDFTFADFAMLANGVIATMYFKPGGLADWRRHLRIVLDGIRADAPG
ncbi:TetR/AcrR family transcriptional regulator [Actinomadura sp. WMMA1423]|uniref:TetR/AcrR family transcriptional regulator n=1 Tax=Actinomadura sp. WMMA1423 TaxID=2591108 RepID=UPI00114789C6|nr:TetR/AcrR family transcriptional regulator [Actinomadura sp. WMMA1423]